MIITGKKPSHSKNSLETSGKRTPWDKMNATDAMNVSKYYRPLDAAFEKAYKDNAAELRKRPLDLRNVDEFRADVMFEFLMKNSKDFVADYKKRGKMEGIFKFLWDSGFTNADVKKYINTYLKEKGIASATRSKDVMTEAQVQMEYNRRRAAIEEAKSRQRKAIEASKKPVQRTETIKKPRKQPSRKTAASRGETARERRATAKYYEELAREVLIKRAASGDKEAKLMLEEERFQKESEREERRFQRQQAKARKAGSSREKDAVVLFTNGYHTLSDFGKELKDPDFSPGKTEILYLKDDYIFRNGEIIKYTETETKKMGLPKTISDLKKFYVSLGKIKATRLETIYEKMQGEYWGRNYQKSNEFINAIGASHTTMIIGDAILIGKQLAIVNTRGFIKINLT